MVMYMRSLRGARIMALIQGGGGGNLEKNLNAVIGISLG
jgi:hypothetical protein